MPPLIGLLSLQCICSKALKASTPLKALHRPRTPTITSPAPRTKQRKCAKPPLQLVYTPSMHLLHTPKAPHPSRPSHTLKPQETASPAPGPKQRKCAQCPGDRRVTHEVHEGRVCKLVVAQHVQHVTHVVAAAQQHQGPRDTQVDQAAARVCLALGLCFVGLQGGQLCSTDLRREALQGKREGKMGR